MKKKLSSPEIFRLRTVAKTMFFRWRRQKMQMWSFDSRSAAKNLHFLLSSPKKCRLRHKKPRKNVGKTCITMTDWTDWRMTQTEPEGKDHLLNNSDIAKTQNHCVVSSLWFHLLSKKLTLFRPVTNIFACDSILSFPK